MVTQHTLDGVTHLASDDLIVALDELTPDDLLHLLWIRRSAIESERLAAEEKLRRSMWSLLRELPASERVAVARELQAEDEAVTVLFDHLDIFLIARFGSLAHPSVGAYRCRVLDAVAA